MDLFAIITLIGGLAFFLYGMHTLSFGLEKIAGGKLEKILRKMTSTPIKGLFLGMVVTAAIQSSSAVTVILVGLVNSGIMQLSQSVGVIMGSNMGTTLTAWILSLIGVEGNNIFVKLLKPENFSLIFAFIGIAMIMMSKVQKRKDIGTIFIGFSILMMGMKLMSSAVSPLADMPEFASILTLFENPFLGVLVGTVITAVIQSSSASVGILQALSLTGSISYNVAIPIIMGQNIGTCITSLISSVGVNKNAKRVAALHIIFNLLGTIICLVLFYVLTGLLSIDFLDEAIGPVGIAVCHSIFNIFTTALLFPFSKLLVKISEKLIKDTDAAPVSAEGSISFIDERLLATPSFAVSECTSMTKKMALLTSTTINRAIDLIFNYNGDTKELIEKEEGEIDVYEDKLGSYLVKLSGKELSDKDSREVSKLLHTIGDFERISDHAVNLVHAAKEIDDKDIRFSSSAQKELNILTAAIKEIIDITIVAFRTGNLAMAEKVEPLEQVIDSITGEMRSRHIERLRKGECTIELGFVLSDILNNYQRISDHCSNIAVAMIEVSQDSFETHEYLGNIKSMDNEDFRLRFNDYQIKYKLNKN